MPWKARVAAIAIAGVAFATGRAHATPNVVHLNCGGHLNSSDCTLDDGYRYLEVNITQQVTNDAASAPFMPRRLGDALAAQVTLEFTEGTMKQLFERPHAVNVRCAARTPGVECST